MPWRKAAPEDRTAGPEVLFGVRDLGASALGTPRNVGDPVVSIRREPGMGTGEEAQAPGGALCARGNEQRSAWSGTVKAKDNEAPRDGRPGVAESRTTREAGTPTPGDPVEGRGRRDMEPSGGKITRPQTLGTISTKLARIAELAREDRSRSFRSLAH